MKCAENAQDCAKSYTLILLFSSTIIPTEALPNLKKGDNPNVKQKDQ